MKINSRKTEDRASRIAHFAEKLFFFSAAVLLGAAGLYGQSGSVAMPIPSLTPGVIRTTDSAELCSPKFRTSKFRVITKDRAALKQICMAYGVSPCPKRGKVELDDLIPVELGGKNVKENVWVQPADMDDVPGFQAKDHLENYLKRKVCATPVPMRDQALKDAQEAIRSNWYAAWMNMLAQDVATNPKPADKERKK